MKFNTEVKKTVELIKLHGCKTEFIRAKKKNINKILNVSMYVSKLIMNVIVNNML